MTRQIPLPLPHREAMEADDYIVTGSNHDAVAWVNVWPEWPAHTLVVTGPAGSGKTHLMHLWLHKSRGKILPVEALREQDAGAAAMSNRIIAVDDADKAAGNATAEQNLFHLYNLLRETGGHLLLTGTKPVAQWGIALADLRSRLLAAPVAKIGEPDDELLSMLLIKQFHDRQIDINADVVAYLVPRLERTTAALRRAVAELDRASLAEGRGVTIALARRLLEDKT